MTAGNRRFVRHRLLTIKDILLDADVTATTGRATIVAGTDLTGKVFSISGYNALVVRVNFVFVAGTRIDILPFVALSPAGTLAPWQWVDSSSTTPALTDLNLQHATGGADDDWAALIYPFVGSEARLNFSAQGATTDTIEVQAQLFSM